MRVRIIKSRKDKYQRMRRVHVVQPRPWPGQSRDLCGRAHCNHLALRHGHSFNNARLVLGKALARVDHAIEKQIIRNRGRRLAALLECCGAACLRAEAWEELTTHVRNAVASSAEMVRMRAVYQSALLFGGPLRNREGKQHNSPQPDLPILVGVPLRQRMSTTAVPTRSH